MHTRITRCAWSTARSAFASHDARSATRVTSASWCTTNNPKSAAPPRIPIPSATIEPTASGASEASARHAHEKLIETGARRIVFAARRTARIARTRKRTAAARARSWATPTSVAAKTNASPASHPSCSARASPRRSARPLAIPNMAIAPSPSSAICMATAPPINASSDGTVAIPRANAARAVGARRSRVTKAIDTSIALSGTRSTTAAIAKTSPTSATIAARAGASRTTRSASSRAPGRHRTASPCGCAP